MDDIFLVWRETYAVGHYGLDAEHKNLTGLINEIAGVGIGAAERLSRLSNDFHFASIAHFRHENSVMRDIINGAYLLVDAEVQARTALSEAAVNDHCAEHARALLQLEALLQTFKAAGQSDGARLASELRTWFVDHAINHDAHLKEVFQGSESVVRPLEDHVLSGTD